MINVLLVDDHDLVRIGIKSLLKPYLYINIIDEATNGKDAIKKVKDLKPDIVLMDVHMPEMDGLTATKKIKQFFKSSKVIVITANPKNPLPNEVFNAGAMGFITKDAPAKDIINAINEVLKDKNYISPSIEKDEEINSLYDEKLLISKLSKRETQILKLIANGNKVVDISEKLNLSTKTINTYRYRMFSKLGISSDVELTRISIKNNWVNF